MTSYAIVVGINDYKNEKWKLTSAVDDANRFLAWALKDGGVEPENATLLLSRMPKGASAVKTALAVYLAFQDAIDSFAFKPVAESDRLYIYFAGHGISAPNVGVAGSPVLVCADVEDLVRHRKKLYQLDEIIDGLSSHGPREQFIFVDACRNFALDETMTSAAPQGAWRPKDGASACKQYALYATAAAGRAFGEFGVGVFSKTLLEALSAQGPRLQVDETGDNFVVGWNDSADYVVKEVTTRITRAKAAGLVQEPQQYTRVGSGNAALRTIPRAAMPKRTLEVNLQPSAARGTCRVVVTLQGALPVEVKRLSPPPELPLPVVVDGLVPGTYSVNVENADGNMMFQAAKQTTTLWKPSALLEFELETAPLDMGLVENLVPATGELIVDAGERGELDIVVRDSLGNVLKRDRNAFKMELPPGAYTVQVMSVVRPTSPETVRVTAGLSTRWTYRPPAPPIGAGVQQQLAQHGLGTTANNYVVPSELLGPMPDQTLGSLLGLAAFAQIFPANGDLQKLSSIGVQMPPVIGTGMICVLVANSDAPIGDVEIGLMEPTGLRSLQAVRLPHFQAAIQALVPVPAGVHTVRVRQPSGAITSYAVTAIVDRISTLVVVDGSAPEVQQYILPGSPALRNDSVRWQIEMFIRAERIQRRFALNQIDAVDAMELGLLMDAKWVDPLFAAIGGYMLMGRGDEERWQHARNNMLDRFGDLPDSHVLAGLSDPQARAAHFVEAIRRGVPAVSEGVRTLVSWARRANVAIPPALEEAYLALIPGTPWTSWTSPRPRIPLTANGLGAIPPGWEDVADHEDELVRLFDVDPTTRAAPAPGMRIAVIDRTDRVVAPGVVLDVDADGFTHDCSPGNCIVVELQTCALIGHTDSANPTRARKEPTHMGNKAKRDAIAEFIDTGHFELKDIEEGVDATEGLVPDGPLDNAALQEVRERKARLKADPQGELEEYREFYKQPKLEVKDVQELLDAMETALATPEKMYDTMEEGLTEEAVLDDVKTGLKILAQIPKCFPTRSVTPDQKKAVDKMKADYKVPSTISINPNEHHVELCDPAWWKLLWAHKVAMKKWPEGLAPFAKHDAQHPFVYNDTKNAKKVALMADFGVGQYHSEAIATQLGHMQYPYVFHLGDVYYSGTQAQFDANYTRLLQPVMAHSQLFSLPENHELYSGGHAYAKFLKDNHAAGRTLQEGSYFCVRFAQHQFVGLDVNWNQRQRFTRPPEYLKWFEDVMAEGEKKNLTTILLTGSAPFVYGEESSRVLYDDLWNYHKNGRIAMWFWGDDHYCALFQRHDDKASFVGSCIGHAGFPGDKQPPSDKSFVPPQWVETEARFPKDTGLRQDLGNNGWVELTMLDNGGVELLYVDWLGCKRRRVTYDLDTTGGHRLFKMKHDEHFPERVHSFP
jgi:hypothetical protein